MKLQDKMPCRLSALCLVLVCTPIKPRPRAIFVASQTTHQARYPTRRPHVINEVAQTLFCYLTTGESSTSPSIPFHNNQKPLWMSDNPPQRAESAVGWNVRTNVLALGDESVVLLSLTYNIQCVYSIGTVQYDICGQSGRRSKLM